MKISRQSPLTKRINTMDLDVTEEQLKEMELPGPSRRLVQEIFPNLTPAEREFIKTGYTQEDWDEMFPPEDDEDGFYEGEPNDQGNDAQPNGESEG